MRGFVRPFAPHHGRLKTVATAYRRAGHQSQVMTRGSPHTVATLLQAVDELDLAHFLDLRAEQFEGFTSKLSEDVLPLDLVWFDCGGLAEYTDFTLEYWPLVNPNGGLIIYHSTLTNAELRAFTEVLIDRQRAGSEFELLNLLEPQKKLQNSLSILRRRSGSLAPLYTWEP